MKKTILFTLILTLALWWQGKAQTLNQPANWPNTNWVLDTIAHTGSGTMDIEANPTVDATFAYDDDDTGSGSHDAIAAESPVIDLTAAHNAGENFIKVSGDYVYNHNTYSSSEYLAIEYWDSDASSWTLWYQFPNQDTQGAPNDNYCSGTHQNYVTTALDISGFSATQLSGFKYRLIYNDNTSGGNGWNWGFCFGSPTISSSSVNLSQPQFTLHTNPDCANSQFSVDVEVTDLGGSSSVTISDDQGSAIQQLSAPGTVTFGPYPDGTDVTFTVTSDDDNSVSSSDHIQYFCPPANDDCDNAISLSVNNDTSCTNVTHGTNAGATQSSQADDAVGTPNDDVWFSFVAPDTRVLIKLLNVTAVVGSSTDMAMAVYSGNCSGLTLVKDSDPNIMRVDSLVTGNTYYLRVYGWGSGNNSAKTEFDVCVTTLPPIPANDACSGATEIASLPYNTSEDATGDTNNDGFITTCSYGMNDGVWFKFVPANDGTVDVTVTPNGWDAELAVYSGNDCSSLSCADNADDNYSGGAESVSVSVTAGTTYWINVGYYSASTDGLEGPFDLSVTSSDVSLSVHGLDNAGFRFYPNPTQNILHISATEPVNKIQITNISGQVVLDKTINNTTSQIDISRLPAGVYMLTAVIGDNTGTYRLIKE